MKFSSFEVPRCQAKSKRSGLECRKVAMQGKIVCRTHDGAPTGPKTIAGRQRCAAAKTVQGAQSQSDLTVVGGETGKERCKTS